MKRNEKPLFSKIGHTDSYLDRREKLLEAKKARDDKKNLDANSIKWAFHFNK